MAHEELDMLLLRIRDDVASEDECARARTLLAGDPRVPEPLRSVLDDDDRADAAAALLSLLGVDDGLGAELGEAIAAEARGTDGGHFDRVDVAGDVMAALDQAFPPVAPAVRHEAGRVDVSEPVAHALDHRTVPIAAALREEAGRVDLADAVLGALGLSDGGAALAEAVRAEAGPVDVTDDVQDVVERGWISAMLDGHLPEAEHRACAARLAGDRDAARCMTAFADLGRTLREGVGAEAGPAPSVWAGVAPAIGVSDPEQVPGYDGALVAEAVRGEAGAVDVADAVIERIRRDARTVLADLPEPANDPGWGGYGAILLAAIALLAVLVGGSQGWLSQPNTERPTLDFASAREIVVDDLSYDKNAMVQVIHSDEQEGALIIWVDEEAML